MPSSPLWPGHHTVALLLCSLCLLLTFVLGLKEQEIDLKAAAHTRRADDKFPRDVKFAGLVLSRKPHESVWSSKNKPNKSSSKKYVEGSWADFQYGKSPKAIYDKKYFDYLPAEVKDSPEIPSDVSLSERINSRRIRRNTDGKEQTRTRRQGMWYVQPVTSYSYDIPQYIYPNDWRLQYNPYDLNYRPTLHNQYLPPVTRIPPPTAPTTSAPAGPAIDIDPGMRGSFNEDQQPFAFDVVYDPSRDTKYRLMKTTKKTPIGTTPNNFRGSVAPTTTTRTTARPVVSRPTFTSTGTTQSASSGERPSIQHNSDDEFDWSNLGLSVDGFGGNGQSIPNPGNNSVTGGTANRNSIGSNRNRQAPSKCTWAIANCCSHNSDKIRYYCFEQNQCFGAFWGENVCLRHFEAALREIEIYYNV
ncbi:uncharacterized protein LOC131677857 isoform X2 [Topomyia yanbarensis]|uniref:uncharacterized protein LOC131677857 isoform X2 n=1 Tax=Topomyia yanbarensis TaxID=2498891 RepID=UPI00273AF8E5|nr:uncharacterized protein LOC131677857 isoform X2 [Topomyia yanbarensis]